MIKYCGKCGNPVNIAKRDKFCRKCGQPISNDYEAIAAQDPVLFEEAVAASVEASKKATGLGAVVSKITKGNVTEGFRLNENYNYKGLMAWARVASIIDYVEAAFYLLFAVFMTLVTGYCAVAGVATVIYLIGFLFIAAAMVFMVFAVAGFYCGITHGLTGIALWNISKDAKNLSNLSLKKYRIFWIVGSCVTFFAILMTLQFTQDYMGDLFEGRIDNDRVWFIVFAVVQIVLFVIENISKTITYIKLKKAYKHSV